MVCPQTCCCEFSVRSNSFFSFRLDPLSLQKLLCWLEDTHIRRYVPSERRSLRKCTFDLSAYCASLSLPACDSVSVAIPYLLDTAISLHYSDCASVYNVPVDPWAGRSVPISAGSATSVDLISAARNLLSTRLGVPPESIGADLDAGDLLTVIADVLESKPDDPFDELGRLSLGFSSGDTTVDKLSTAIRLLHVRDLWTLQHCINDAIAGMQAVTANPKTDSKLGKVGR